jgi:hypothetical protein
MMLNDEQRTFLRRIGWFKAAKLAELVFRGFDINIAGETIVVSDLSAEEDQQLYDEIYAIADEKRDEQFALDDD